MFNVGDVVVRVLGDTKQLGKDIAGAGDNPDVQKAGVKAGTTVAQRFGATLQKHGAVVGAAIGATFAEGINAAAEFKDQIATIETVAGKGAVALNGLDKGALQLSKDTGKPIADINQGLYDLVSAGVPASKALEVLKASSNLAIGGLGSTAEAVDAVSSAMNAYGQDVYTAGQITDVFAQSVAAGKVTTAEIGASIATVAPIAAQAGIGLEEIGAAYGTLTAQGVPAAEATTKMRSAIVALLSPNETLNNLQAQTGKNFAQIAKEKGLQVALSELREATDANGESFKALDSELSSANGADEQRAVIAKYADDLGLSADQADKFAKAVGKQGAAQALAELRVKIGAGDEGLVNALGRVEAYQFALATTGDQAVTFGKNLDAATEQLTDGGLAAEQAAIKMDSPVEAGKRLAAQFKALQIETFGPFADSLGPAVVALNQMGGAMGALIRPATLVGGLFGKIASKAAGPLASGLSSVVSRGMKTGVVTGVTDGLKAAASSSKVQGATGKLGDLMGSKLGKGLSVAFAAIAVIEVIQTYQQIQSGLNEFSANIGKDVGTQIVAGTTQSLEDSRAALSQGIEDLSKLWYNPFAGGQKDALQRQLDDVNAELQRRAALTPTELAKKLEDGKATVAAAAGDMAEPIPEETAAAGDAAAAAAGEIPGKIADEISDRRDTAKNAMEALVEAMKHPMTKGAERARLIGYLTSKRLAQGLKSGDPEVRARAEAARETWRAQLAELPGKANKLGADSKKALAKGLKSENPAIRREAERARDIVTGKVEQIVPKAAAAGSDAGAALAQSIAAKLAAVQSKIAAALSNLFGGSSTTGGGGGKKKRAHGGPVEQDELYMVGEHGPELYVPDEKGYIVDALNTRRAKARPELVAGDMGGGSGTTIINMPVSGALPVRTITDISGEMQRIDDSGVLPDRRIAPRYRRRETAGAGART